MQQPVGNYQRNQEVKRQLVGERPVGGVQVKVAEVVEQHRQVDEVLTRVHHQVGSVERVGGRVVVGPQAHDEERERARRPKCRVQPRNARNHELLDCLIIGREQHDVAADDEKQLDAQVAVARHLVQLGVADRHEMVGREAPVGVVVAHHRHRGQETKQIQLVQASWLGAQLGFHAATVGFG